jgi:DNA-binding XRE family transcriptional regulator
MDMGLFQKDVAGIIGVSTDTITYWEKGRTKPCKKNMHRIEQFLKNC